MSMTQQLFPLPGSKASRTYDYYLYPPMNAKAICEPFMGACSSSIRYHHLPCYLGEINPAQRAIALALHNPQAYIEGYRDAENWFWYDLEDEQDLVLSFAGQEKAQSKLSVVIPEIYQALTVHWKQIVSELYQWMHSTPDPRLAGYYAFCIRACFGNVMRLNPKGTHFNVTWHVDKLQNACQYNPQQWLDGLRAIDWNPNVFDCWESAIASVPDPSSTWLLLDPPYACQKSERMTPCYPGHQVTTENGMSTTFKLATDSLLAALEREFKNIAVCNYDLPELDAAIQEMAASAGYVATKNIVGKCKALGNSNGRFKHGERIDKRSQPIEVIYQIRKTDKAVFYQTSKAFKTLTYSQQEIFA